MYLKYRTKCTLSVIFIGCISLVWINFAFKDNSHKTFEERTNRIIIESPKATIPENKEAVNDEGTRVTAPTVNGKPKSAAQPLPVPDTNTPIVISPLLQ